MAKDKNYMPQSTAGLVRYFDEYHESITIKPEVVVGMSGAIVLLFILARAGI
ncbi:MAG: preprotein translocase subunit Sec61beta [Candidatus Aenigmarchaeota archaeon]|nr:preprotein translocase subunit Sec61beta [Candidatus Aenigmarchaeota archaeon]